MKTKLLNLGKKSLFTIAIPASVMMFCLIFSGIKGIVFFETQNHINSFVFNTVTIVLVAWALSFNLPSGRFDFSLGALGMLSSMTGAKITLDLIAKGATMNGWMMLLFTLLVGAILGTISGLVYVTLKLPPIVTSLGMALIYEGFTYIVSKGQGVTINNHLYLAKIISIPNLLIVLTVSFFIVYFLSRHSTFGYNGRALSTGQIISVHAGINEKSNAVLCYMIAGSLMAVSAGIALGTRGSAQVYLNFSSTPSIFVGFLPMYLGGFIGRYTENKFGILLGALTVSTMSLGFVRFGVPLPTQSLISALTLLIFLIYLNNEALLNKYLSIRNWYHTVNS